MTGFGLTTVASRAILGTAVGGSGGRADQLAQRLADAIRRGLLADGERLPPEPELARQARVATVTLRDALSTLRDEGLVVTRRGRGGGTFVRAPQRPPGAALSGFSVLDLRDLGDERAAVAGHAALLAAERSVPDEVTGLRRQLERLADAAGADDRGRRDAQLAVAIASAAQSARLTRHELQLRAELGELVWLGLDDDAHAALVRRRRAQVAAIASGRGPRARTLAEEQVAVETRRLVALRLAEHLTADGAAP